MKLTRIIKIGVPLLVSVFLFIVTNKTQNSNEDLDQLTQPKIEKNTNLKTISQYNTERYLHEYYRQANTRTGTIPYDQKEIELSTAKSLLNSTNTQKSFDISYRSRGPSNLGGRSRALVIDKTDPTENTIIAGGVSGGVFRTTDGGSSWTKVSPNDDIFNVSTIVQDPRSGFENIWYYGTGEWIGNSASLSGALYRGQGIWKSEDGGLTWSQMPGTDSVFSSFDSDFDYVFRLAVHPITGDVYAACLKNILRFNGTTWISELTDTSPNINLNQSSDVVITDSGRVYLSYGGGNATSVEGIWTSETGIGGWTRINTGSFTPTGRIILGLAPSNQNKLYCFYYNGNNPDSNNFNNNCPNTPQQEADLWMWDQGSGMFTDFSNKLVYEGGCLIFNDPFSTFSGYTMSIGVKPDDENFVVIGGTNAYRIDDITNPSSEFERVGGYISPNSYAFYDLNGDDHHPDLHVFAFSDNDPNVMLSASDGGIHRTADITEETVSWTNLNNNFQTYQFYHVNIDPQEGSDLVIGGSQDNGTSIGGTDFNFAALPDLTTQFPFLSGDGVAVAISRNGCEGDPTYFMGVQNGVIYRVCDAFDLITPSGSTSQFVTYFYMDEFNNNVIYYAGQNTLYRTTDSQNVTEFTWSNLGNTSLLGSTDFFQYFAASKGNYDPSSSYLLMGGDEGRIFRLDDPHNVTSLSSAIEITPTGAAIGFPSIVTGLAVHPNNNDIVMASYANYGNESIFLTTNATDSNPSWTLIERNLSAFSIRSAAIIEKVGDVLYVVGTARGLYSSADPLTTDWQLEAENEIGIALISDLKYRDSDAHFLIGTHGNGMYEGIPNEVLSQTDFEDYQVIVYPNPAKDWLTIKGKLSNSTNFQVFDISGKSVLTGKLIDNKIGISQLAKGVYFLSLENSDKRQLRTKFLIK